MTPEPKWMHYIEDLDSYARECGGKCYVAKVDLFYEINGKRGCVLNVPKEHWDDIEPQTVAFPLERVSLLEFCETHNKFTPGIGKRRKYFMEKYGLLEKGDMAS